MISDAELLSWTKADEADTDLLRSLERAAIATVEHRTGRYFGVSTALVEIRTWRGALELMAEPDEAGVVLEERDGDAWAVVASSGYYLTGRTLRGLSDSSPIWDTPVRATYTGGYTADVGDPDVWDAPEEVKDAVRTIVGLRFLFREGVDLNGRRIDYDQIVDAMVRDNRRVAV